MSSPLQLVSVMWQNDLANIVVWSRAKPKVTGGKETDQWFKVMMGETESGASLPEKSNIPKRLEVP